MSQGELAVKILNDNSVISKVEKGQRVCTPDLRDQIKVALDAEDLPVTASACQHFRVKLNEWYNVINKRELAKAKDIQQQLAIIKLAPHEKELNTLYDLFDCKLLIGLNKLEAARKILKFFDARVKELKDMQLYYYYYNKGTYEVKHERNQEALDFYMQAHEIIQHHKEQDLILYFNIAHCCERLGLVSRAIAFLEKARDLAGDSQKGVFELKIYNALATLYIQTGHFNGAKKLLTTCLTKAEQLGSNERVGIALINHGFLYRIGKAWETSIEYLDNALPYLEKGSRNYLETYYQKGRCLVSMKHYTKATSLLEEIEKEAESNEVYTILFKSLRHMMPPNISSSIEYIESVAIPYLVKNYYYSAALDFCEFLRKHYKKKREQRQSKLLNITEIVCDIHNRMIEGGVVE